MFPVLFPVPNAYFIFYLARFKLVYPVFPVFPVFRGGTHSVLGLHTNLSPGTTSRSHPLRSPALKR